MNPKYMHMYDFHKKYQEKREENRKLNDISLINNQLARMIKQELYQSNISKENDFYKQIVKYGSRFVQSCTIMDLRYRNNFESLEVAALQYLIIEKIRKVQDKNIHDITRFKYGILNINGKAYQYLKQHERFFNGLTLDFEKDNNE